MSKRILPGLVLLVVAWGLWPSPLPAAQNDLAGWKAGVAKTVITPAKPMWMSGYASRNKPAEGKVHDLWAKALVLQDPQGRRAALVTMDLVSIHRDLSLAVRDELQQKYGLDRAAVRLSCSHTHCGPLVGQSLAAMFTGDETQRQLVDEYARTLHTKLVAVVGEAIQQLAPARLSWGNGTAAFAVNRRNNKEAEVPKLRAAGQPLKGPVDHAVAVLAVHDGQDRPRAVVCGYACHATTLGFYQWCGDYPGFAQLNLEAAHPGAVALFWAGCGADQNPLPRRTVELAQDYGKQLSDAVEAVLRQPLKPIRGAFGASYIEVDLPFASVPDREQLLKDRASTARQIAARAKALLEQLEAKGAVSPTYPYPVQVWQLGPDLTWIALGGEVVVDYALRFKRELGPERTWVAGYSNDVTGYIPSARVLQEGGYEGGGAMVWYGLPSAWAPPVEDLVAAAVHDQVKKVRGR
jgi:hypothetical protein